MPKRNARPTAKADAATLRSGGQQIAEALADCAGCGEEAGPFAAVLTGRKVLLCAECAGRLLRGEAKGAVMLKMTGAIPPRHN
jgi:hypothetical protein